ncbi:MAG: ParB/RepB/Spo0J family partition protein [Acutalibacteraceae bacterium]|nr:ParB/RepB/Spo0J family partition protein [Acutalibacteraceae bacterium]
MNIQSEEKVVQIPISQIRDFPEHPYKVKDDESMNELVDSIMQRGLIQPVIIRPTEDGNYEMVSGHRRKRAFEIAGIKSIPARVKEMTRDEAILAMVDSNLQREVILPSEKAFAYKMRLEAMNRQGERTDLTCSPVGNKLNGVKSVDIFAEETGDSKNQIYRFIRLTNLIPELLELVDEGRIAMRPAVEISYLPEEAQMQLYETIDYNDATPSHYQAIRLRNFHRDGKLTQEVIEAIMSEEKPNQKEKSPFRDKRIVGVIPKNIPQEKHCEYVIKAIDFYNRHLQRVKNNRSR